MRLSPARAAIVLLFLVHALFYIVALGYDAVDDAYISFRYAQNAILGHGLVFNAGERVEGFTNFLWTALMIPIVGAGLDVGRISIILGILFGLGTLWLTVRLARTLQLPPWVGRLAALLLAVDGSFAIWSVSGLETAMFAFLLTAGATLYILEQQENASVRRTSEVRRTLPLPASAILFALAAMTRPEAAAVFALTVAHQFMWRAAGEVSQVHRTFDLRRTLLRLFPRWDIARGFTFAALFVPYWLLRWGYYRSFFPNSFYAKVAPGGPIAQLERGWHYLTQFVDVHLGWWILLPALVALVVAAVRQFRKTSLRTGEPGNPLFGFSYLALVIAAYGAYVVYVGGDWSVGRFFVPVLPALYLLIAAGLGEIYSWFASLSSRAGASPASRALARNDNRLVRVGAYVVAVALVTTLAYASSWKGEYGIFVRGFDAATATAARETMGRWLKANVPSGTLIAVDAAGQVPYFSELPAIDMFGINDLHIGRLSVPTLGEGTPGHEKFDLAYVITRAPQYVVIYGNLFDTVTEYRRAGVEWTGDAELTTFLTLYERR